VLKRWAISSRSSHFLIEYSDLQLVLVGENMTYHNRAYSGVQACTDDCSDKMLIMAPSIAVFGVLIN